MTQTESPYPDIEVYIRGISTRAIKEWVEQLSESPVDWSTRGKTLLGTSTLGGHSIPVHVIEEACEGYHCLWWESDKTPWKTDLDCAREVFKALGGTVRCSLGSWSGQPDDAGWMEISSDGERTIQWDNPA
ncbi:MAG: hypothetical protein D6758_14035 [Gammaproteobacteria bacterium]|nr:MAG: hypothetical protein D6758_14035 [Gammaproteobacteria bacterium]